MAARPAPLLFPATAAHTATVIFMHGLGDTAYGWSSAVENWRRRQRLDEVKFILPTAPAIPVTCNGGYRMPGWYDILEFPVSRNAGAEIIARNQDEPGILASQQYVHGLIQQEVDAGVPANRIILGGFSQGGAVAIFAGLTAPVRIAGIVGMSSYLLLSHKFRSFLPQPEANKDTHVLMCHGDSDPVVHTELGKASYETLSQMGYNVSWKEYEGMGHSACLEELDDVEAFLRQALPPLGAKAEGKSEL